MLGKRCSVVRQLGRVVQTLALGMFLGLPALAQPTDPAHGVRPTPRRPLHPATPVRPGRAPTPPAVKVPVVPPGVKVPVVLPGWLGKIEVATCAPGHDGVQYWWDSDGVDPLVAGCHYPFKNVITVDTPDKCNTGMALPAGTFGELCVGVDVFEAVGLVPLAVGPYLVETNPNKDVCHSHKKGVGHPDVYDCDRFCKGQPAGFTWGQCEVVPKVCNGLPSARCECKREATPTPTKANTSRPTPANTSRARQVQSTPTRTATQTPTKTPK